MVVSDLDQTELDAAAGQLDAPASRLHAFAADVPTLTSGSRCTSESGRSAGWRSWFQSAGVTGA